MIFIKNKIHKLIWYLIFTLLMLMSAWVRVSNFPQVLPQGYFMPPAADAAYHFRRSLMTSETFPQVPVFDPLMNWPEGGNCPWASGLDQLTGCLISMFGSTDNPDINLIIAAMVPVIFGILITFITIDICRMFLPDKPGYKLLSILGGLIITILPQSLAISRFGRLDHHVCETFFMAALGAWVLKKLPGETFIKRSPGYRITYEAAGALITAGSLYFFAGSVLYIAIITVMLIFIILKNNERINITGSGGPALIFASFLIYINYSGLIHEHGHVFSYLFPSLLQPLLVFIAGISCIGSVFITNTFNKKSFIQKLLFLSTLISFGILAAFMALPSTVSEIFAGISEWLMRKDPWLSGIDEFQPLTSGHSVFKPEAWNSLYEFYGQFGYAVVLFLIMGLTAAWKQSHEKGLIWIFWTISISILTLWQNRFGRIFTVNLSVCAALSMYLSIITASKIFPIYERKKILNICLRITPLIVITAVIVSGLTEYRIISKLIPETKRSLWPLESAGIFICENSPLPEKNKQSGVHVPWDWGHFILQISERPVVATGFGHYAGKSGFEGIQKSLLYEESNLLNFMQKHDIGWLIGGPASFYKKVHANGIQPFTMNKNGQGLINIAYLKSRPLGVLINGGSGIPEFGIKHSANLFPRWASQTMVKELSFPVPMLWVYEKVPGARLKGFAQPGTRVIAEIELYVWAHKKKYTAWADSDNKGFYQIIVPLPCGLKHPSVSTGNFYVIRQNKKETFNVIVGEEVVRKGQVINILDKTENR
ncbi:Uncharacterized protein dnl_42750 [Desulfonema limicola]|uniref:Archaeal glycosylation protein B peripheral domain-containing protein n=1 Tax=Desulfonema limicola TaxID=45656 RepID=A0A975BAS1_9BACT|nr:hypothetical protein [Desulfonema limicola]QTA81918.1 Uncharacterized protein dnl_42750 [Desulfonema limicola]